jgi:hypothetical protein
LPAEASAKAGRGNWHKFEPFAPFIAVLNETNEPYVAAAARIMRVCA